MYTPDSSTASVHSIGHGYNTDTGGYNVQAGDNGPGGDTSIDAVDTMMMNLWAQLRSPLMVVVQNSSFSSVEADTPSLTFSFPSSVSSVLLD